jgi:hypothetical protein
MANFGRKLPPNILVLEGTWDERDLSSRLSVIPFFDAWAGVTGLRVGFRTFHDHKGLKHWLTEFADAKTNLRVCYIASHGTSGRLGGAQSDINQKGLIKSVFPRRRGRPRNNGSKGILIGACNAGNRVFREQILAETNRSLNWIAGYDEKVPWLETIFADLMFLSFLSPGKFAGFDEDDNEKRKRTGSAKKAAAWLTEQFPIAGKFGFGAAQKGR